MSDTPEPAMRSPQLEDGYICLAHELDAAIAAAAFGKVEGIILREIRAGIYGPARLAELQISPAAVARRWGLSQPSVSNALTRLVRTRVLARAEKGAYAFNKHYDQWTAANGKPLFNEALLREIPLAPARAVAHKTGGVLPPKMVERALGTTVIVAPEPSALPAIDTAMDASHAEVTSRPRDLEVTRTLVEEAPKSRGRDGGSHEGVMTPEGGAMPELCPAPRENDGTHNVRVAPAHYVERAGLETGETGEKGTPPTPSRPSDLPPGSDVVLAIAEQRWGMVNGGVLVSALLRQYKNAALVLYAIEEWWNEPKGEGKRRVGTKYLRTVCDEHREAFRDAPPPAAPEPEPPPNYHRADPERARRRRELVEAAARRRREQAGILAA